jgi:Flp pilus assembly protein TadD
LVYNHNFPKAIEVLNKIIEEYPSSIEAYNLLAYA